MTVRKVASNVSRVVILIVVAGTVSSAQTTQTGAATLRGVVVTDNDVPLARVRVAVMNSSEAQAYTDAKGQFTLRVPESGTIRLVFTKARYATVRLEVPPAAADRRDVAGLRVRLSLGAVISGYVRDRSGDPVLQAQVTVRRPGVASAVIPTTVVTTTDDLGEFRFAGLSPGTYVVQVLRVQAGAERNVPTTFDEQTVHLSGGSEVGVELRADMPSELARYPPTYTTDPGTELTASMRGRVTTPRGTPLSAALVQVRGPGGVRQVESNTRGEYVLDRLAPGSYTIEAIKRGFSPVTPGGGQNAAEILLGRFRPPTRTILLGPGESGSVNLTLGRGAAIVGTIVDEFGEPMQGVAVSALELRVMGGVTRAIAVSALPGGRAQTDDRGRYRLFGLQPGTYVVQATADTVVSATSGYVQAFYPGTPEIDSAIHTTLDADAAAAGIDFTFQPTPTRRLRGTVVDAAGNPIRARLALTWRGRAAAIQAEPLRTFGNSDGSFAFNNVAHGEYVIHAMATAPAGPEAWVSAARQYVTAGVTVTDEDPPTQALKLSAGATLRGRVTFEGIEKLPRMYTSIQLIAVSADSDNRLLLESSDAASGFALLSDNTFEYRGVFGRTFLVPRLSGVSPDSYVKSITYRGQDLADSAFDFGSGGTFEGIDVVVSSAGAVVGGRVTDEHAAPVRDYTVVIFPTDRSKWTLLSRWFRIHPPSPDGTFRATGLAPGDYWFVAVDRLDGSDVAGDLQSPDILDTLASRAVRVTLAERESQNLTLRLIRR